MRYRRGGRPAQRRMARGGVARGRRRMAHGGYHPPMNGGRTRGRGMTGRTRGRRMNRGVGNGFRADYRRGGQTRRFSHGGTVGTHHSGNRSFNCPGGGSTITADCVESQRALHWT